jgi:hypothetical protein
MYDPTSVSPMIPEEDIHMLIAKQETCLGRRHKMAVIAFLAIVSCVVEKVCVYVCAFVYVCVRTSMSVCLCACVCVQTM